MKKPAIFNKNKNKETINTEQEHEQTGITDNSRNTMKPSSTQQQPQQSTTERTESATDTQETNMSKKQNATKHVDSKSNNAEFAKKGSLLGARELKKIGIGCFGILAFFITLLVIFSVYKSVTRNDIPVQTEKHLVCQNDSCIEIPGAGTNECETNKDCKKENVEIVPSYAYIKDKTEIYTATVDGKEKKKVLSINDQNQEFTTLTWKDKDQITYAKCEINHSKDCSIETLNLKNRSITPEIIQSLSDKIRKIKFNNNKKYFAYIGQDSTEKNINLTFYIKTGTVKTPLKTISSNPDPTNIQTRILFTNDNNYIVFSAIEVTHDEKDKNKIYKVPQIYIYQINGILFDRIENATDPFIVNKDTIGFSKNNQLMYKKIGNKLETSVTPFKQSYNPVISFDKRNIAYWKNEGGFSDVLLGIYNIDMGIHRNILRGVIIPTWVTNNSLVGIKADGCIGQACLLYEFQTTSLVLVNIENGDVTIVDQGKSISNIDFLQPN